MDISIYGLGCNKYFHLLNMVKKAASQLNLKVNIKEIYYQKYFERDNIVYFPSLAVNDKIVLKGNVPTMDELEKILVKYSD